MRPPHRDSQGLYRALGLGPDADDEQIQLAYEMLCEQPPAQLAARRTRIERAYSILSDRRSRAAYDRIETSPPKKMKRGFTLNDPRLLAGCVALLLAVLVLVWVPLYGSRLRSLSAGDELKALSGRPFGKIVQSDEDHEFPGGLKAPGFLVQLSDTGELRWFPAADLQAACRRAD